MDLYKQGLPKNIVDIMMYMTDPPTEPQKEQLRVWV